MKILTSSLFSEVNSYYSISHKVHLVVRDCLNESIVPVLQINREEKKMEYINLSVSTSRDTSHVEVSGPAFNKKEKIINWELWLPYKDIVNSQDQLPPYLKYYFDALVMVFENYCVSEESIRKIQRRVETVVLGNDVYKFDEEDIELDLSDLDLN